MLKQLEPGESGFGLFKHTNGNKVMAGQHKDIHNAFTTLEEQLAWLQNLSLVGVNIKQDDEGFFVILKVKQRGRAMVHFTGGRTFFDAVEALVWEIEHDQLRLRPDRYG